MTSAWNFSLVLVLSCIQNIQTSPIRSGINVLRTKDLEYDGWTMVFRAVSGNGNSVYHAWKDGSNTSTVKPDSMERSHSLHYRRSNLNNLWSCLGITLVKFAFYDADREVAYVIFNGTNSSLFNWFDKDRVIESSWPDLTSGSTYNKFSIDGHFWPSFHDRRFYINRNYGGCPKDRGHLIVINSAVPFPICLFDNQPSYPTFIYSKFNSVDYFQRRMFGAADFMAVFVKYE